MDDYNRERAVTASDYESLARAASNQVAIARALGPRLHLDSNPPLWGIGDPMRFAAIDRSRGNVNVIIAADNGPAVDFPQPSAALIAAVQGFLSARRPLGSMLAVIGPRYLPVNVVLDVVTLKRAIDKKLVQPGQLAAQVAAAVRRFLHPINGNVDHKGWQVGESVKVADLIRAVAPRPDLGSISNVVINPAIPQYHFPPLNPGGTATNYVEFSERGFTHVIGAPELLVAEFELACWDPGSKINDKGIV